MTTIASQQSNGRTQLVWPQEAIDMMGRELDKVIAARFGMSTGAVQKKRTSLGIPPAAKKAIPPEAIELMGRVEDSIIAKQHRIPTKAVQAERIRLGIKSAYITRKTKDWPAEAIALLGKIPDKAIASQFGMSRSCVQQKRQSLEVEAFQLQEDHDWTPEEKALLGTIPDTAVAAQIGIKVWGVTRLRRSLDIHRVITPIDLPAEAVALLGVVSDWEISRRYGLSQTLVFSRRHALKIPAKQSRKVSVAKAPRTPN